MYAQKNRAEGSIDHGVTDVPYQHRFSPYDFNGGTVAAVAGDDYCVIAADTRLSSGYEILSRNVTKLHALNDKCVLASSGCKTDVDQLRSVLDIKMKVQQQKTTTKDKEFQKKNQLTIMLCILSIFLDLSIQSQKEHVHSFRGTNVE